MTDYRVEWTTCGRCGLRTICCVSGNERRCALCATRQRDEARALFEEALKRLERIGRKRFNEELRKQAHWLDKEAKA